MDREGLAPTKFKTADLQSAPVAAWVTILKAGKGIRTPEKSLENSYVATTSYPQR